MNFVTRMLELMNRLPTLRIVNDQTGAPTAASSLADVLWAFASIRTAGTYHWSDAGAATWYQFANAIAEDGVALGLMARAPTIVPIGTHEYPTAARRPRYSVLDRSTTETVLGYSAAPWRERLRATLTELAGGSDRRSPRVIRRLLITGGAGFIGSNFTHFWAHTYPNDRLVVLDALTYAGSRANLTPRLDGRIRFVEGDIANGPLVRRLLEEEHIETIVNFAAETHVDRSIDDPQAFIRTNVVGTQVLLDAARSYWRSTSRSGHRFHHVSTDEVYGSLGPNDVPFTERHPYSPNSPYAASKAAADHLVRAYGATFGLPFTISNCSNNYGPYQFPEKLIPLCLVNLLQGRRLPLYGDGRQVRDWLHVHDHCRAIALILTRAAEGTTWNIGGGAGTPNVTLIERLCDLVDQAFAKNPTLAGRFPECPAARGQSCRDRIEFVEDRPGHDRRYAIDGSAIERELNFRPEIPLETGLSTTIDWYLEQEPWWRSIKDGTYRRGLVAKV